MAYEKQTWECGDVISAEKMNHMEDGIADAGGGGDAGYECSEKPTEIINEEATTTSTPYSYYMGTLSYSGLIDAPTISVSFDGQQYELPKVAFDSYNLYGGSSIGDFSNYPIQIQAYDGTPASIYTPNEGTYSVKVTVNELSVDSVTPCFSLAVKNVVSGTKRAEIFFVDFWMSGSGFYCNTSYEEVRERFTNHDLLVARYMGPEGIGPVCHSFISDLTDDYGTRKFTFMFLRPKNEGIECSIVTLKPHNEVSATIKTIALTD